MTFPIRVLDDVMYCTRTKPGLGLYFPDSLSTLPSLQSMMNSIFLWRTVLFCNTLTYQIQLVAILRCLCLCKQPKWRLPALAWDACQSCQASGGWGTVHGRSWTRLLDQGKLCGQVDVIRSSPSWLHGYYTVVYDFWEIKHMCKQWIPGPSFSGRLVLRMRPYFTKWYKCKHATLVDENN